MKTVCEQCRAHVLPGDVNLGEQLAALRWFAHVVHCPGRPREAVARWNLWLRAQRYGRDDPPEDHIEIFHALAAKGDCK